ncbi:hypothetical protein [Rhizobacter sp. P5_C2]
MTSSETHLRKLAAQPLVRNDPGFELVLAFDYYDGPESGIAVLASGQAVRFTSLGDSNSRLFRAFEFHPLQGSWWPQVLKVPDVQEAMPLLCDGRRVLNPGMSEAINTLQRQVFDAPVDGAFIGVGAASWKWLTVMSVREDELYSIRQMQGSPLAYRTVHGHLKRLAQ